MKIASDEIKLDIVEHGLKIYPNLKFDPKIAFPLSPEVVLMIQEVALLKRKNRVDKAKVNEKNTFVSGVFTRSEKDRSKQMIFNLKKLNKIIDYKHFKMDKGHVA